MDKHVSAACSCRPNSYGREGGGLVFLSNHISTACAHSLQSKLTSQYKALFAQPTQVLRTLKEGQNLPAT